MFVLRKKSYEENCRIDQKVMLKLFLDPTKNEWTWDLTYNPA